MTAGVGKMELVQMPEGSTYINESTQSRGDDECLPNVPLNAFFAPCRWIEVSTDGRLGNKLVTWLKKKGGDKIKGPFDSSKDDEDDQGEQDEQDERPDIAIRITGTLGGIEVHIA